MVEQVVVQHRPHRLIIGGKSMGGRVASYIASDMPQVRGLVFLGYPLHPPSKSDQLRDQHLYELKIRMLFVSGTKDTFAERELLQRVVNKIGDKATLVWIDGGDHSFKRFRGDAQTLPMAKDAIVNWLNLIPLT